MTQNAPFSAFLETLSLSLRMSVETRKPTQTLAPRMQALKLRLRKFDLKSTQEEKPATHHLLKKLLRSFEARGKPARHGDSTEPCDRSYIRVAGQQQHKQRNGKIRGASHVRAQPQSSRILTNRIDLANWAQVFYTRARSKLSFIILRGGQCGKTLQLGQGIL